MTNPKPEIIKISRKDTQRVFRKAGVAVPFVDGLIINEEIFHQLVVQLMLEHHQKEMKEWASREFDILWEKHHKELKEDK